EEETRGAARVGRVIRFECAKESERARADRPPIGYLAWLGLAGDDHLTADLEPDVTVRAEVGQVYVSLRIDPPLPRYLDLEVRNRHRVTVRRLGKRSKTAGVPTRAVDVLSSRATSSGDTSLTWASVLSSERALCWALPRSARSRGSTGVRTGRAFPAHPAHPPRVT